MPRLIKTRLAIMMFIQYVAAGATWPIMTLYLKDHLGFTGIQTGWVMSMAAVAAFISPIVSAFIADRLMSSERLLSVLHVICATMMLLIRYQDTFWPVLIFYLGYYLAQGPTMPLTNAIVFHNHPGGNKGFGNIRVWGTIGWIAVAWGFGFLWLHGSGTETVPSRLPDAFILSAIVSIGLAIYALTLPNPHYHKEGPIEIIPRNSLRIFIQPRIILIALVSYLIGLVDRMYYFGMAPFLSHVGFSDAAIMPLMSIGQISEVLAMLALSRILLHRSFKQVFLLGILAEITRFSLYAVGHPPWAMILTIPCHGLAYTFYFTAVYIYIDGHCDRASRAGLHLLFALITGGIGSLSATLLSGFCMERFVEMASIPSFRGFWLVPASISIMGFLLISLLLKSDEETSLPKNT